MYTTVYLLSVYLYLNMQVPLPRKYRYLESTFVLTVHDALRHLTELIGFMYS